MKKIILSVAILATFLTACKKKKDDSVPTPVIIAKTTTQYLTAHPWKIAGSVTDVPIDADDNASTPDTTDLWDEGYAPCEKDDVWSYFADSTGTFTDAGTVCPSNTTPIKDYTWTLTNNELVITFSGHGHGASLYYTLISVDDNTLKLSAPSRKDPHGKAYVQTITYIK
jgi:hypothetical protein